LKEFTGVTASGQKSVPIPSLRSDEVMPSAQLERKVEEYLRNSEALEDRLSIKLPF
jgi:hypothetical protein